MPKQERTWSQYAQDLAVNKLSLAALYALSSMNPKTKSITKPKKDASKPAPVKTKPAQKKDETLGERAGRALKASKMRYEQAARISRGEDF